MGACDWGGVLAGLAWEFSTSNMLPKNVIRWKQVELLKLGVVVFVFCEAGTWHFHLLGIVRGCLAKAIDPTFVVLIAFAKLI